jgi:putative AbiEii toxin of type IV toxin-antitoxin system
MLLASDVPRLAVVELTDVRGFENLRLTLAATDSYPGRPAIPREQATVVIGRNGTNKSTLLRAIAIGVASHSDASAMLSTALGSLVRTGAARATIRLTYAFETGATLVATKEIARSPLGADEVVYTDGPSADALSLLVCGYGAARGITGTDSGREYRVFDAVATLFDYRRELLAPELTLRRLADYIDDDERYRVTLARVARLIGLEDPDAEIATAKGGGVTVSSREIGRDVPLEGLADGYRVAFNWVMDLFGRALRPEWLTADGSVAGLILIDEIDQHLHPELQTQVVTELTRTFPDSQFVVTTHSPLVALGAHPSQLVVLRRSASGIVTAADSVPDFRSYSPEDVLTDDRLFNVDAHNPEFARLLDNYDKMAQVPPEERSEGDTEELRKVAAAIRSAPRPGYTEPELVSARDEIRSLLDDDLR